MRRTLPYLGAWFVAGLLAVTLASAGVSMVTKRVTADRPGPLSATQVRDEFAGASATPSADAPTTSTTEPVAPPPTAPPTVVSTDGSATPATSPPPTDAPVTASPAPPPVSTASVTRAYELVGGTVTLRFTSAKVTVLAATPKPGFSVELNEAHDNGARIEFESGDHRSRVDAWWDGGPQDEVREEN